MNKKYEQRINTFLNPVNLDEPLEIRIVSLIAVSERLSSFTSRPYLFEGKRKKFNSFKEAEEARSQLPQPPHTHEMLAIQNFVEIPIPRDPTKGLTTKQAEIYRILECMIDALDVVGVDVSYFPEEADNVVRNYAIDIAKRIS